MKINNEQKNHIKRIKFQEGEYGIIKEVMEGVIVNFTKNNQIIAIEIINVSKRIPKRNLKDFAISISD